MTERPDQSPLTSVRSQRVRKVAALAGRSARRKQNRFRVEGPQAVRSLLSHQPELASELFVTARCASAHPELERLAGSAEIPIREVDEQIIRAMVREESPASDHDDAPAGAATGTLVSPQGVIAVARLPVEDPGAALTALAELPSTTPVTVVVLHEVRDPGNVGTLIRTADAAGADLVILTRTSADPFSPKAVRAATGSVFHLPVVAGADSAQLLSALADVKITGAATSGHAETDVFTAELPARLAWLLGNEAHGLNADVLREAPLRMRIPLAGHAESLNVHIAATVCLFETLRRRRAQP